MDSRRINERHSNDVSADPPQTIGNSIQRKDSDMDNVLKYAIIDKTLPIAAAHITKADSKKLDGPFEERLGALIVYKYKHGWWVNVWYNPCTFKACLDECNQKGYSEDFLNLLRVAHAKKCNTIRIDYVGPLYKKLPTHNWYK
jgi:hypothetical protein